MLRKFLLILCVAGLMAVGSTSYAYMYSLSVEGMSNPSGFEGFYVSFDVDADFDYTIDSLTFGNAVLPGTGTVVNDSETPSPVVIQDWAFDNENPSVVHSVFKVGGYNGDVMDVSPSAMDLTAFGMPGFWAHTADGRYTENNLIDGVLFTFEYNGTINGYSFRMIDSVATETGLADLQGQGISIIADDGRTPVPIPGAVWLLGSGFLGLVTIRRRRAKV